jgi:microsomal dipeptidase-like Zn-dependent dipeptidase
MKVANFHCDLLWYLSADDSRSAYDPESRTSIPLFLQGGVAIETLAIYEKTKKGCRQSGEKQFQTYKSLNKKHPDIFGKKIHLILAIENGSTFCDEEEMLDHGLKRLEQWLKEAGRIAYISMTWNDENRFGGGNATKIGLKKDGEKLLEWMSGKNIAIDLSHTSDPLAHDILNYIDKRKLLIVPVASHSNFRVIANVPRNLPDEIAKEIVKRGGLIGLNFVRAFLGSDGPDDFIRQVEHARNIDAISHLCFGADFFDDRDIDGLDHLRPFFLSGYEDSSCYPKVIELLRQEFSEGQVAKIAYDNLAKFYS